jgi:hypothetical protein
MTFAVTFEDARVNEDIQVCGRTWTPKVARKWGLRVQRTDHGITSINGMKRVLEISGVIRWSLPRDVALLIAVKAAAMEPFHEFGGYEPELIPRYLKYLEYLEYLKYLEYLEKLGIA